MINFSNTRFSYQCCGCRACEQICPKGAIAMHEDNEGFLYPILIAEKCVDCGLCEKVCPIQNSKKTLAEETKVYAAVSRDEDTLLKSSSGGIFTVLAENVLRKGGIVYGAAFDKKMNLYHIRATTPSALEQLRGSKYLQSDLNEIYCEVKEDLKTGYVVYFVGTPCQVAGLKLFLIKKYDNLITSDLICHGTPSQKIFSHFVTQMGKKKKAEVTNYFFRDKYVGGWSCTSTAFLMKKNRNIYLKYDPNMLAYFNAFIKGHLMRYVCYECPFACKERAGDITLADYWGIDKYHPEIPYPSQGMSLVMINTERGEEVWSECLDKIYFFSSKLEYAIAANSNLREPTPFNPSRESAYRLAFENYEVFCEDYLPDSKFHKLKFYLRYYLRKPRKILKTVWISLK